VVPLPFDDVHTIAPRRTISCLDSTFVDAREGSSEPFFVDECGICC